MWNNVQVNWSKSQVSHRYWPQVTHLRHSQARLPHPAYGGGHCSQGPQARQQTTVSTPAGVWEAPATHVHLGPGQCSEQLYSMKSNQNKFALNTVSLGTRFATITGSDRVTGKQWALPRAVIEVNGRAAHVIWSPLQLNLCYVTQAFDDS